MSFGELVLAAALLSNPPNEVIDPTPFFENMPTLRYSIGGLAIKANVLDPREFVYFFNNLKAIRPDIKSISKRFIDLSECPMLSDVQHLPSKDVITDSLRLNRQFFEATEHKQLMENNSFQNLDVVKMETDALYKLWDAMQEARTKYYYVPVRREALKTIYDIIGRENYYSHCYPPPVPIWRFKTIY